MDRAFSFGPFSLSEATRSLVANGARVDLPPRYFDLLLFLIERRDRVVTKDDLYEHIWKDEIVTEGAIAQGVRHVRRSLGDDARKPRYIRTVSKFGYQWIGAMDDAKAPDSSVVDAESPCPMVAVEPEPIGEITTAFRFALSRYASASLGAALAGILAGGMGALILIAASAPSNPLRVFTVLSLLGCIIGGLGGIGVGFGLSFAESLVRKSRAALLALAGGVSGAVVGGLAHAAFAATVASLFGRSFLSFGGAYEGVWIGAFTGFGYGLATRDLALAAPRRSERLRVVATAALFAALGAAVGTACGATFSGASVHAIAALFRGSELSLSPLGVWLGEPDFGRMSGIALSAYEGLFFGGGLVYGLTRRPHMRS